MDNIFLNSKNVFLDVINNKDYIQLDRVSVIYQSLRDSISKPLKMILFYGKPGTGKSMFLSKLYNDLRQSQEVYLYSTPILDESEFYKTLAQDIFKIKHDAELNFTQFMAIVKHKEEEDSKETPIIILDEAQLYSQNLMEKIRLVSDTRKVKFLITLHKTEKEDIIAKEHFQTRIWETIELQNATSEELKMYIQKKLMQANCFDSVHMFTTKAVNRIHSLTNGNYRDTNKLLYTLFDLYTVYEKENKVSALKTNYISIKMIEMSAIHTGLINV